MDEVKELSRAILSVQGIDLRFGGVVALSRVEFGLYEGELLALIGPNGAGKTALLNCINGFYRPQKGSILFNGHDLTRLPPHRISELGIGRTFQNVALYGGLTTVENLMAGRHVRIKYNWLAGTFRVRSASKEEAEHRRVVEEIIELLEIEAIRWDTVDALPYGLKKRVELGRALATDPSMLVLDEPMAGMNVEEKADLVRFLLDIYDLRGIPIILVEHDMGVVMDIADRIVVMDFGRVIGDGTPQEISCDPGVIKAYLGKE